MRARGEEQRRSGRGELDALGEVLWSSAQYSLLARSLWFSSRRDAADPCLRGKTDLASRL